MGKRMRRLALAALPWGALGLALAQGPTPAGKAVATAVAPGAVELDKLTGAWVRPDGGYVILIKGAAANGELQASYFNPNPLPFATAMARRDGEALRVTFELRAGGYNGSIYELRYDAATDRLTGTFYQAVAKQTYGVQFSRK